METKQFIEIMLSNAEANNLYSNDYLKKHGVKQSWSELVKHVAYIWMEMIKGRKVDAFAEAKGL
jgi:hypothetical protein